MAGHVSQTVLMTGCKHPRIIRMNPLLNLSELTVVRDNNEPPYNEFLTMEWFLVLVNLLQSTVFYLLDW